MADGEDKLNWIKVLEIKDSESKITICLKNSQKQFKIDN